MDKKEATTLLDKEIARLRNVPYQELLKYLESDRPFEIHAQSGKKYQMEVMAMWDDKKTGRLRVCAAIDDKGLRAFFPLSSDFLILPDGSFFGE